MSKASLKIELRNVNSKSIKQFKFKILPKDSKSGFKFLDGLNRAIIPAQVTKLANSITNMGLVRPVVVANLKFKHYNGTYIIDGQHLFYSCIRLNIDIPYVEIDIKNEQELVEKIALLNASSKSWVLQDYILAWSSIHEDYKVLSKHFKTYDFELSVIASMLMNIPLKNGDGGNNSISKNIKNGSFRVKNEKEAIEIFDYTTDILKIVPRMDRTSNRIFISAYTDFVKNNSKKYDHTKFLTYIKKNKEKFTFVNGDSNNLITFFNKAI